MEFTFAHNNLNVMDLDQSLQFYQEALGLKEEREKKRRTAVLFWHFWQTAGRITGWSLLGCGTGKRIPIIWATMSFTLRSRRMIWMRHVQSIKKWDASVLKIRKWVFTLFPTRTDIGSRSYLRNNSMSDHRECPGTDN